MPDYSSRCVAVVDNGLFVEFAALLAQSFGKVYYCVPGAIESAFPKSNGLLVGQGLDDVERIESIWPILDEPDLWVFPDIYHGPLQEHLVSLGKRVWGSRMGEELELYRDHAKQFMRGLGIPIGEYAVVRGLDALRAYLKKHERQYVKISKTRGDMESFRSETYALIEPKLDELEHVLGAKKYAMEFLCEDAIDDAVEVGYDGYCVDGQFPTQGLCGIEVKDKGYLGQFQTYAAMPEQIREVNARLAPTLKDYQYRNFLSVEMRITPDGTPWVIDPCTRAGAPPNELVQMMYTNLPDIFWYGADGECVDPEPAGRWGAELLILSDWADRNWQAIEIPAKVRPSVKLRNLTVINGRTYVVPQSVGLPEIGAVVAVGDTAEQAIERCKAIAEQIEGYFLDVPATALDEAAEEYAKLEAVGGER